MGDARARSLGLSNEIVHDGGTVITTGPSPRLSRTPVMPVRLPKPYGADGIEILDKLGLGEQAAGLVERGIVRLSVRHRPE
jgi:crotonobetainyl-CoA:carnitine CoA-transferase CaiB-like acyl-CoA transferase